MNVLSLSSSRAGGSAYLEPALPLINNFLKTAHRRLAFVPFAAADGDYEGYAARVQEGLAQLPYEIVLVTPGNAKSILDSCDAVLVGGGNTFKLLHDLYHYGLFAPLQQKVAGGMPYIGWSAGANLTGKTICTTNDMPIVEPQSFTALGFLPFQLNPHYHNVTVKGFHGETRDQRLAEFLLQNPGIPVVGLPEGTALQLQQQQLRFLGNQQAVLFRSSPAGTAPQKQGIAPGEDLSFLL